jgi:hypothetical protein
MTINIQVLVLDRHTHVEKLNPLFLLLSFRYTVHVIFTYLGLLYLVISGFVDWWIWGIFRFVDWWMCCPSRFKLYFHKQPTYLLS